MSDEKRATLHGAAGGLRGAGFAVVAAACLGAAACAGAPPRVTEQGAVDDARAQTSDSRTMSNVVIPAAAL